MAKSSEVDEIMELLESDDEYAISFWKSSTKRCFKEAAQELLDHGFGVGGAADFLAELYSSCGGEYGN